MSLDTILKRDIEYSKLENTIHFKDLEISNYITIFFLNKFIKGSEYKSKCIQRILNDEHFLRCLERYKYNKELIRNCWE